MARPRPHLEHAPIVEALIDFKVVRTSKLSLEVFSSAQAAIGSRYVEASPIESIEARFGVNEGRVDSSSVRARTGTAFKTKDAVAQFRVDGFTFNKLEPYTTWEDVFGEAIRLWRIYAGISRPSELSRLAVRYINRLKVPAPAELREYLEAPPMLPPPIPQRVREYLSRIVVEDVQRSASAVIVQALEAAFDPAVASLLIDIDAFRQVVLAVDDPGINGIFQTLRELKNEIFFATITEHTAEIYS